MLQRISYNSHTCSYVGVHTLEHKLLHSIVLPRSHAGISRYNALLPYAVIKEAGLHNHSLWMMTSVEIVKLVWANSTVHTYRPVSDEVVLVTISTSPALKSTQWRQLSKQNCFYYCGYVSCRLFWPPRLSLFTERSRFSMRNWWSLLNVYGLPRQFGAVPEYSLCISCSLTCEIT